MRIFVGCSSRDTDSSAYNETATKIGNFIAHSKHTLVFGGSKYGLMGKVYEPVSRIDSSRILVTIATAYESDLEDLSYYRAFPFATVNERKNCFINLADVLVFLPGGLGTLDELFTAIEAKRAHEHYKPILIVNTDNFFEHFFGMLKKTESDKFADNYEDILYHVVDSAEDAIAYLNSLQK